jgi:hypothetical protein
LGRGWPPWARRTGRYEARVPPPSNLPVVAVPCPNIHACRRIVDSVKTGKIVREWRVARIEGVKLSSTEVESVEEKAVSLFKVSANIFSRFDAGVLMQRQ